jgi:hypothetical protein
VPRIKTASSVAATCLLVPALASGTPLPSGAVTIKPAKLKAGSHVQITAEGDDAGFRRGQIPEQLSIAFNRGFVLRPAAVKSTCTEDKAMKDDCPATSVLGKGSIQVVLAGARYTANLRFFRAQKGVIFYFKENESGFNGASTGEIRNGGDPYGKVLAFDRLPLPDLPPGLDIRLDKLQLDLGATGPRGKCTKYEKQGKGKQAKRRCVRRAPRPVFVRNPPDCPTGSWGIQLRWGYKNGEELREGSAPCATTGQTPPPQR